MTGTHHQQVGEIVVVLSSGGSGGDGSGRSRAAQLRSDHSRLFKFTNICCTHLLIQHGHDVKR